MGALIETKGNGGTGSEKSYAEKTRPSNPVVYQLVRVGVDGRLVPATDDELMEVEHLLEDDKNQVQRDTEQFPSVEWLLPKTSDLQGVEVDSQKSDARSEDEGLQLKFESIGRSPKEDVVGKSLGLPEHSQSSVGNLKHEKTPPAAFASPPSLGGSGCTQLEMAGTILEHANDSVASRSSNSETCTSSEPDFSILKGELCFDNLTIRQLQEVFRATFGRHTSVKDKLWLKRRITMGLTNSCEVSDTGIAIKDNKVVQENVEEESCNVQQVMSVVGFLPANQITGSVNGKFWDSPDIPIDQIKDEQVLSVKRVRKPLQEYDVKDENIQTEHNAAKRTRKPTKRYIEELSDVETRECTGALARSVVDHHRVCPKSPVKTVREIGSHGTTFVTRKDSIGGCGIQIPFVSRMRRGRPRKDLYALMNFGGMGSYKMENETPYGDDEDDLGHEMLNPMIDTSSDNYDDALRVDKARTPKLGVKRKHHRSWTLCEVLKLVEGVARYGAGRWSEIRRVAFSSFSYRTSVDLKDKWRNLIRASFAQDPLDKGVKNFRRPTSASIPTSILLRVRELVEMHSQAGIEFGPSKFASHGERFVQEKASGFL